jgi:cell division initiation protein
MRIAPIDIAHKTFARKMMGLDQNEVIEFLRDVADQMEEIIRERNTLKENMREKELAIMEYRERDETLKSTITTATRMAEQIRVDAEREAKLITNDANQKAEFIVKDARDSLKRIYQEVGDLKRARMQFEANVRSLAQAHLAMLDQAHNLMPDFPAPPNWQAQMAHHAHASQQHMSGPASVPSAPPPMNVAPSAQVPQPAPAVPLQPTSMNNGNASVSADGAPLRSRLNRPTPNI